MRPPSMSSWCSASDALFDVVSVVVDGVVKPAKLPGGLTDFARLVAAAPEMLGSSPARAVPIDPSADSSCPRASASAGDDASAIFSACERSSDIGIWFVIADDDEDAVGAGIEGAGVGVG